MKTLPALLAVLLPALAAIAQPAAPSTSPPHPQPLVRTQPGNLQSILDLYSHLTGRTVLLHPASTRLAFTPPVMTNAHTLAPVEAEAMFRHAFEAQGIAVLPDGDKFVMVVPMTLTNSVRPRPFDSIISAAAIAPSNGPPAGGVIDFQGIPARTVVQIYGSLANRQPSNLDDVPLTPIYLRTGNLSRAEVCYALETLFEWNGLKITLAEDARTFRVERR